MISQGELCRNINRMYNSTGPAQKKCSITPTAKNPGCFTKVHMHGPLTQRGFSCSAEQLSKVGDITSVEDYLVILKFER